MPDVNYFSPWGSLVVAQHGSRGNGARGACADRRHDAGARVLHGRLQRPRAVPKGAGSDAHAALAELLDQLVLAQDDVAGLKLVQVRPPAWLESTGICDGTAEGLARAGLGQGLSVRALPWPLQHPVAVVAPELGFFLALVIPVQEGRTIDAAHTFRVRRGAVRIHGDVRALAVVAARERVARCRLVVRALVLGDSGLRRPTPLASHFV
jgi:hypothetical protein